MNIAARRTSLVVSIAFAGLLLPGAAMPQGVESERTALSSQRSTQLSPFSDTLGDFFASYRYERLVLEPSNPGGRPAPPRVSSGVYQVCRKGAWTRISLTATESGGHDASGATIPPLPSMQAWLFRDGQCVAFIDGANYVENPEPGVILDTLPPFGSMGMVLTKDGSFKTEAEIAEGKPVEERPTRTIEQRGEATCEVIVSRRTMESAHATVSGRGLVTYDGSGRRARMETHSILTFADGRTAELPGRIESVDRWIDGLPSRVEVSIHPRGRQIWDQFQSPEEVASYLAEGRHVANIRLTMELTNFRDPAPSDLVAPADFAGEMAFVRSRETDPPRPVWTGTPGESTRNLEFDADALRWRAATAAP